jgi:hypothetical protein
MGVVTLVKKVGQVGHTPTGIPTSARRSSRRTWSGGGKQQQQLQLLPMPKNERGTPLQQRRLGSAKWPPRLPLLKRRRRGAWLQQRQPRRSRSDNVAQQR